MSEIRDGRSKKVANPNEPMSYRQAAYIGRMAVEKAYPEGLNKQQASELIDEMLNEEGISMLASKMID